LEFDTDCDGLTDGLEVTVKDSLELNVAVVEAVEQIVGE
jgi:hypothetical protein